MGAGLRSSRASRRRSVGPATGFARCRWAPQADDRNAPLPGFALSTGATRFRPRHRHRLLQWRATGECGALNYGFLFAESPDVRDNKGCREANSIPAIIGYGNAEISKSVYSYLRRSGKEFLVMSN